MQKKVCIAFLGNALHDSRIVNLTNSLKNDDCNVSVISFDWFISNRAYYDDTYKIYKLEKTRFSFFFYFRFSLILIKELIKSRADIYFAEDFYTLPFVKIIGKIKKAKVYYNSRELYAFLGGLRNRPILQWLFKTIEKIFIRKVDLVLTTGEMDSHFLEKFYDINNTLVIRNIPLLQYPERVIDFRAKYNLSSNSMILLYQGVLLEGRGISLVLKAIQQLPETALVLIGDGEQRKNFERMTTELNLKNRVFFVGAIHQNELINYTAGGDIGLSIIENISVSYYHALPNKLFEYIMAGLPVLTSDLPQMKRIVETYQVGEAINISDPGNLVRSLKKWIDNPDLLREYKNNCPVAAKELNWQEEYNRVRTKLLGID
ncbi:MAG: glycosyltransferase [Melioribacteraceae bacterium]|nr:glycosyltransferase [Melioribacteraceae bacterium]